MEVLWSASRLGRFTPREKCSDIHWIGGWVFPDWVDTKINNKHSLRSNTKGYGGKTH
jgi:hypothetical protein